jgi:hypothetical protein
MWAVVLLVRSWSSWSDVRTLHYQQRDESTIHYGWIAPLRTTYQSWELDMLGEICLIRQSLFGGQES